MIESTYLEWEANRTMDADYPPGLMPCVEKFFESEATREPGQDVYQDVFDTDLFFPLQRQRELAVMMQIARSTNPKVVFEIGADKGGGLYHWCKSLPSVERVIACEIRGLPYQKLFEKAFPHIDFLWLEESSYAPAGRTKVAEWLGEDKIDCLFIDGDKAAFDRDFDVYLPMVRTDGIVFMHDIQDASPGAAYQSVCARGYKHEEVINIADAVIALDEERQGIPIKSPHEGWLRHWKGKSCGVGVIFLSGK